MVRSSPYETMHESFAEYLKRMERNAVSQNTKPKEEEIYTGVLLRDLALGDMVFLTTSNTYYRVNCRGKNLFWIDGNPQTCPKPRLARIHGSVEDAKTDIVEGFIGKGLCLLFGVGDQLILRTTPITKIEHYIHAADKFEVY